MRLNFRFVLAFVATSTMAMAESYTVEPLSEGPPAALAEAIRLTLGSHGYRVVDGDGKPYVDLWLREGAPATAAPSGPSGALLFPVLTEGELLGALRYSAEGHDYRDQPLPTGIYTFRYGIQPENGDHLGVSPFRDFALLVGAAKDASAENLATGKLDAQSSEAAGSTHPAVLMLLAAPEQSKAEASMNHDEVDDTWGVVLPLMVKPEGSSDPVALPIQLVVSGAAL